MLGGLEYVVLYLAIAIALSVWITPKNGNLFVVPIDAAIVGAVMSIGFHIAFANRAVDKSWGPSLLYGFICAFVISATVNVIVEAVIFLKRQKQITADIQAVQEKQS